MACIRIQEAMHIHTVQVHLHSLIVTLRFVFDHPITRYPPTVSSTDVEHIHNIASRLLTSHQKTFSVSLLQFLCILFIYTCSHIQRSKRCTQGMRVSYPSPTLTSTRQHPRLISRALPKAHHTNSHHFHHHHHPSYYISRHIVIVTTCL